MSFSPEDLAAIEAALAKGEAEVQFSDRRVRYRSVDELLKLRQEMLAEQAADAARPRIIDCVAGKGFA